MTPEFSVAIRSAANQSAITVIGAGSIKIRDEAGTLLASVPIQSAEVSDQGAALYSTAPAAGEANGQAHHAEYCDDQGASHIVVGCLQGTAPVSGYLVMGSLTVVQGQPVELVSAVT